MDQRLSNSPALRIDPDKLRVHRRQKKWTQRDLACASGFTEDYISQLERISTTRNKGTKLETIIKLAQSLDVFPTDLLLQSSADELSGDFIRQDKPGDFTVKGSQFSASLPDEAAQTRLNIRIDPDRLREIRLKKPWTQRDVAAASGFSEDYISQLERAPTTRNKGTRLETILRLAHALEVPPLDLLSHELTEALYADVTRRQFLDSTVRLGMVELLRGHGPLTAWYEGPRSSKEAPKTVAEYLSEPFPSPNSPHQWLEAEKRALEIRTKFREGGEEWAEITLRLCAQMRQQASDVRCAQAYIREVEQRYVQETDRPSPLIKALIHSQRGWLAIEQYGYFEQANKYFTNALREAQEAGDRQTESTACHFRLRSLSELAMCEGGAWLGARPTRTLSSQRLQSLHKSLREDWRILTQADAENLHHYNRRFIVDALIQPQEALREIPNLMRISQQAGSEFILALSLARWHFSNEEWDIASQLADEALQGYSWIGFPQGVALASALRAKALFQNGLRTKVDCYLNLDLWILALLLHPYTSHPLWHIVHVGVDKTVQYVADLQSSWLRSYFQEIALRIEEKEGVFQALKYIYVKIDVSAVLATFAM